MRTACGLSCTTDTEQILYCVLHDRKSVERHSDKCCYIHHEDSTINALEHDNINLCRSFILFRINYFSYTKLNSESVYLHKNT